MRTKLVVACALTAFVAIAGGTAEATGLVHTSGIAKGAVTFNRLSPNVQKQILLKRVPGPQGVKGDTGTSVGIPGTNGSNGVKGDAGVKGEQGIAGTNGVDGAVGAAGAPGANGTNGTNGAPAPYVVVTHVTGPDSSACPTTGPPGSVSNWATDTYTRTLNFVPQFDGSINVLRTYDGTFTTIAGAATPDAPCGVLGASFTGTFTGFDVSNVTGGHFNANATCAANCTSDAMMTAFFPGGTRSLVHGWEYHYDAGAHGTWINADSVARGGNSGNIAG